MRRGRPCAKPTKIELYDINALLTQFTIKDWSSASSLSGCKCNYSVRYILYDKGGGALCSLHALEAVGSSEQPVSSSVTTVATRGFDSFYCRGTHTHTK